MLNLPFFFIGLYFSDIILFFGINLSTKCSMIFFTYFAYFSSLLLFDKLTFCFGWIVPMTFLLFGEHFLFSMQLSSMVYLVFPLIEEFDTKPEFTARNPLLNEELTLKRLLLLVDWSLARMEHAVAELSLIYLNLYDDHACLVLRHKLRFKRICYWDVCAADIEHCFVTILIWDCTFG